ncbi:uncharacterized protein LOC144424574 [Styela clava]
MESTTSGITGYTTASLMTTKPNVTLTSGTENGSTTYKQNATTYGASSTNVSYGIGTVELTTLAETTYPAANNCDIIYNSKCFEIKIGVIPTVSFYDAESLCGDRKLANIYDVTHYNLVNNVLRSKIIDPWDWIAVWTGMTYNYKNGQLLQASGQPIELPLIVWQPNNPRAQPSWTGVAVHVLKYEEKREQGLINRSPATLYAGGICEE